MTYQLQRHALGYMEIENKPSAAELSAYYERRYFQAPTGQYQTNYSEAELGYFRAKAQLCAQTLELYNRRAETLLELGSGEGFFADYFYQRGTTLTLNDLSSAGMERFNPHLLPYLATGDALQALEDQITSKKRFDLITLDNVLEHVLDPAALIERIKPVMHAGSTLRITVPNDYSSFQDLLEAGGMTTPTWVAPPDHLSYFNASNLKDFIRAAGLKIVSCQVDFPIEVFLANAHSNYAKNRSLGAEAHAARVLCTQYLAQKDITAYVRYCEAAAQLEFGRDTTLYAAL